MLDDIGVVFILQHSQQIKKSTQILLHVHVFNIKWHQHKNWRVEAIILDILIHLD